jgi:hypothetical protein
MIAGGAFANVHSPSRAMAAPCETTANKPVITVDATDLDKPLRTELQAELVTALGRQGFTLCDRDSAAGIAQVRFLRENQTVLVLVDDTITGKSLTRKFVPKEFPQDAHALALALVASELLTAAWIEINQSKPSATSSTPAPPAVNQIVDQQWRQRVVRNTSVGVAFASEAFSGGETHLGAEGFVMYWLTDRVAADIGLGFRRGMLRTAPHGEVQTMSAGGFAGLTARLLGQQKLLWIASTTLRAAWMVVQGRPATGAEGETANALSAVARASTGVLLRSSSTVEWRLMLGAGIPIVAVRGLDQNTVVAGASGLELSAQLGGSFRF